MARVPQWNGGELEIGRQRGEKPACKPKESNSLIQGARRPFPSLTPAQCQWEKLGGGHVDGGRQGYREKIIEFIPEMGYKKRDLRNEAQGAS